MSENLTPFERYTIDKSLELAQVISDFCIKLEDEIPDETDVAGALLDTITSSAFVTLFVLRSRWMPRIKRREYLNSSLHHFK